MAIAMKWLSKHALVAMDTHTTVEELLVAVFSACPILRLYNEGYRQVNQHELEGLKASRSIRH
jgi:hypothetical protein